jgi:hypothetical protein
LATLVINGVSFHVEAFAVRMVKGVQTAVTLDESLGRIHDAIGAEARSRRCGSAGATTCWSSPPTARERSDMPIQIDLTIADVADLRAGLTINAMAEGGDEHVLDGRRFATADLDAVAEGRTVDVHLDGLGDLVLWSTHAGGDSPAERAAEAAAAAAPNHQVRAAYEQALLEAGVNNDFVSGVHDRVTELLAAAAAAAQPIRFRVSASDLDRLTDMYIVELVAEDGSETLEVHGKDDLTSAELDRLADGEEVTIQLALGDDRTVTLVPGW